MVTILPRHNIEQEEYMRELKNLKILTHEEEKNLFIRAKAGDKSARDTLITHNMKFVLKIVLQYKTKHLTTADLMSEASIGLSRAVDEFDHTTGLRFLTYAVWWIRAYLTRSVHDKDNTIRVPCNAMCKLSKTSNRLKSKGLNILSSPEEVSLDVQKTIDITSMYRLDAPGLEEDGYNNLLDTINEDKDSFESLLPFEREKAIQEVLSVFTEEEEKLKQVVIRMFGLKTGTPDTLLDIASDLRTSRERIRQIKVRALGIIEKRFIKNRLGRLCDLEKELRYVR